MQICVFIIDYQFRSSEKVEIHQNSHGLKQRRHQKGSRTQASSSKQIMCRLKVQCRRRQHYKLWQFGSLKKLPDIDWVGGSRHKNPRSILQYTDSQRHTREAQGRSNLFFAFFRKWIWRNLGTWDPQGFGADSNSMESGVDILTRLVNFEGIVSEEVRKESRLFAFSRTVVNLSDEV